MVIKEGCCGSNTAAPACIAARSNAFNSSKPLQPTTGVPAKCN
jgi:hypothetical protein